MATAKKTTRKPRKSVSKTHRDETPDVEVVSYVELKLSSQYVFVSDRGVQLSDGVVLELITSGCKSVTVIRTDTKHTTTVVEELQNNGDKLLIKSEDFGESKTLLFTANADTPEGFALTACASAFKITLDGLPTTMETDHEAQAAVIDDFYESLNKEGVTVFKDTGVLVASHEDPQPRLGAGEVINLPVDRTTFVGADKRTWAVTDTGDVLVYDSVSKEFVVVDDDNEILDNLHVPREKLVGVFVPREASLDAQFQEIDDFVQDTFLDDECEDCEIEPRDKPVVLLSPVPDAQLADWYEIADESCRIYVWGDHDLRIDEPRAIFFKTDHMGHTAVVLDSANVAYEIPNGWNYVVRHRIKV